MDQKAQQVPVEILDDIYLLKMCFQLEREMRMLVEENKVDFYLFVMNVLLNEEAKIWEDLERDLKHYQ